MANVKNFGLIGVGSDLQLGKAGTRLVNNAGTFNFKAADGSTDAALLSAGITSSAGNVTLTTGNLVLSDNAATVGIGGATLSRQATGVLKFNGTAAFMAPVGLTGDRPTGVTGMVRVNNDIPAASYVEYYNGTAWSALATGGSTTTLQAEIDSIEDSLGTMVSSAGVWNSAALTDTAVFGVAPASLTAALNNIATFVEGTNSLDEIFPATTGGNVIYAQDIAGVKTWQQAAPGATSGVQGYDAGLTALAAKTSSGILVQTGAETYASRSLAAPTRGFTITNNDGVAANPTFVLANNLAALEAQSAGTGYYVLTGDGTSVTRGIDGTSGRITVTNGLGIASNTNIDLTTVSDSGTGSFVKVARDTYGRVTGTTAVVTSDITALVDATYVNVAGDSMASAANLTFVGGGEVLGLPALPSGPTAAASKQYVDNQVSGLTWKQAAELLSNVNVPLTGTNLVIDGHPVLDTTNTGYRILLTAQTDHAEEGIYVATVTGTPGSYAYTLTRSSDADVYTELVGASIFILEGTTFANTGWVQSNHYLVNMGEPGNYQNWVQFSGAGAYSGGTGVTVAGTVIDANLGAGLTTTEGNDITLDIVTGSALNTSGLGGQLALALVSGGGLTQATGSALGIAATGVTNAMLVNDGFTLNADSGTGEIVLGDTLVIVGDSDQGVFTSVDTGTYSVTVQSASTTLKGVASFNTASFSTTAGAVSLKTVDVAHGGTGLTSVPANQLLYGGESSLESSSLFKFTPAAGTGLLEIGGSTGATLETGTSLSGLNVTLTSLDTNSSIVLMPNGDGTVVIGPAGSGVIQSDAGTPLSVIGNTVLTLQSILGNVVLSPTALSYVDVAGQTAASYAGAIATIDTALTNKYYVDHAIAAGASAGAIKSFQATVSLATNATVAIGTLIPAGATVLSVKVIVTTPDSAATLSVGTATDGVAAFMTTAENDTQTAGMYMAETFFTIGASEQVNATVAGTGATSGSTCKVIFTYQVAQS